MKRPCLFLAGGGTGGHVFPLIAVADELRTQRPELELVFIGTKRGIETKVVPARGYPLELMRVEPILGGGLRGLLRGVSAAALSIPSGISLVRRYRPSAVFSLGGYAAGPMTLAARLLGVPVALLEPNAVLGLSNRLIAPLVARAYTAFPEPEAQLGRRARRLGVPLRAGFGPAPYEPASERLELLVLGGSLGAKALNETVPDALALAKFPFRVLHQCGATHEAALLERYARLGLSKRAQVTPFIDDMPAAIAQADLVIGRAGASAVMELCAVGRPSLLVPYPYAAGQHQLRNAESLARAGAAVCLPQSEASAARVAEELTSLAQDGERRRSMANAAATLGRPQAARQIALDLLRIAGLSAREEVLTDAEAALQGGR